MGLVILFECWNINVKYLHALRVRWPWQDETANTQSLYPENIDERDQTRFSWTRHVPESYTAVGSEREKAMPAAWISALCLVPSRIILIHWTLCVRGSIVNNSSICSYFINEFSEMYHVQGVRIFFMLIMSQFIHSSKKVFNVFFCLCCIIRHL